MSYLDLTVAHLRLVVISLAVASALGIGLGIFASRSRTLERVVVGLASLIQTIPAIALLAAMVPVLAGLASWTQWSIPSIGRVPALIALSAYALLPIVRATLFGIRGIESSIRLASDAVGMTDWQRLRWVEVPLASRSVLGGLRTAAVWTVGMATLGTPVGATSLGNAIFGGLQTRHYDRVLWGCLGSALIAIALDALLALAEARSRRSARPLGLVLCALLSGSIFAASSTFVGSPERAVRIGAKSFTEQLVLAEVLRCALGAPVDLRPSLGTTVAFDALEAGDLDVYVEYTGTAWATILGRDVGAPRERIGAEVTRALTDEHEVHVVASLGFENAYALVVRDPSLERIGDLGTASSRVFGADFEFFERAEWRALQESYGLTPMQRRVMNPSLLYQALESGAVDVIAGYTTDGRIEALGLRALEDERGAIPPYDAIIVVSDAFARERPELVGRLRRLEGSIDAALMRRMNERVDSGAANPREAATLHSVCR